MNSLRSTVIVLAFCFVSAIYAQDIPSGDTDRSTTTLRVQSRIVVIDVVVTDRRGNPVHGLKAADFKLLESGKQQTVKHIEEQRDDVVLTWPKPPGPPLPANVFTNEVDVATSGPLNILLLDKLNTPFEAQAVLIDQMKQYIKSMTPGTRMAIFGLNGKLILLQGFTSDPTFLQAAIMRKGGRSEPSFNRMEDTVKLSDTESPEDAAYSSLQSFEAKTGIDWKRVQVGRTLGALNQLGRYLAGLPGRKNLIWFSGAFPTVIVPGLQVSLTGSTEGTSDPLSSSLNVEDEVQETIGILSRAQVAVYPVDPRGVATDDVYTAQTALPPGGSLSSRPDYFSNRSIQGAVETTSKHMTMSQIASETGGKAFFNTNDLTGAIRKAVNAGSNYYTLTYIPTMNDWHGEYRKIAIKIADQANHYRLSYRTGYYATKGGTHASFEPGAKRSVNGKPSPLVSSLERGAPNPMEILFKARVVRGEPGSEKVELSPHGTQKAWSRYMLDYAIDLSNVKLESLKGTRRGLIELICIVYDQDGKIANTGTLSASLTMTEEQFEKAMQNGLQMHQEISAPSKVNTFFRIAVHDRMSDRVGAMEVQTAQVKDLAANEH